MAMNKMCNLDDDGNFVSANWFTFFKSYADTLEYIQPEHHLDYFRMIQDYGIYNREPDKETTPTDVICHFPQIKALIDSRRNDSINGTKGAEKKKEKSNKSNYFKKKDGDTK